MVYGIYYMVYARVYFTLKNGFLANLSSKKKENLCTDTELRLFSFVFINFIYT